ncbi:MAG: hypothetical protein QM655_03230, partial [Nocardioidaceae bacterium]
MADAGTNRWIVADDDSFAGQSVVSIGHNPAHTRQQPLLPPVAESVFARITQRSRKAAAAATNRTAEHATTPTVTATHRNHEKQRLPPRVSRSVFARIIGMLERSVGADPRAGLQAMVLTLLGDLRLRRRSLYHGSWLARRCRGRRGRSRRDLWGCAPSRP